MNNYNETILIIDFGSQFSQLIARRVREAGVYCEMAPYQSAEVAFLRLKPKAVILSGGPESAFGIDSPRAPQTIFDANIPVLGICYGQMTLCVQMGGKAKRSDHGEFGAAQTSIRKNCELFDGIWEVGKDYPVWMSHGDRVVELPDGFEVFAQSPGAPYAVFGNKEKKMYGVMFHPEVAHTPDGAKLLANFVHKISGLKGGWTMGAYKGKAIEAIRRQVGDKRVICALSGGVDSSVAALLVHEAVGDQLACVLVDHGLMRENEATEVATMYREYYNIPLILVNAADMFISALEGESDPETKRRIIGRLFIEVFEEQAEKLGGADFLVQGTLYPDVIESVSVAGGPSVTIKSHHNVGGLPEKMNMELIEPLRELFKDEVRQLGRELGLPEHFIGRHPFPGPGLAIRCIGEISSEKLEILRKADAIYLDEIHKAGLYDKIWQAFATLLPVRTVGVMGDSRTYEFVCALRAVTSVDGMTADFYHHDTEFLGRTATRIINETQGINRVVYDVTSKPPGTIEWE